LPSIPRDEEFGLFDHADTNNFHDDDGNLWNVDPRDGYYRELGTRHELMAFFWNPNPPMEWHGFPRWPIKVRRAYNRKEPNYGPDRSVLDRMVAARWISERDADRIEKGDHP
jgi:hypothetical protein